MGKGSQTTSNTSTSSAAPQATAAYSDLLQKAQGVAATPYQAYTGELTAPTNSQQNLGISGINSNANYASPYIQQAAGQASASSAPITAQQIQQYQNPYTQDVVNATEAQLQNQNGQQQAALTGNSIAQGALGGNRVGVAQGILGGQQALANNSTIAGLYNQSYQQALQAAQSQQQTGLAGANALANYGITGQNAALTGASAQVGAGTLQQQTQQAADTANYGQYAQQQAYPFQTAQWLAGIDTGVGPGLGSTSTGSTTGPAPNQTSQYLGAGLAAASLFLKRGGRVNQGVNGYAGGGVPSTPWGFAQGWVPTIGMGSAAPSKGSAPSLPGQPAAAQIDPSKMAAGISGLGSIFGPGSSNSIIGTNADGSAAFGSTSLDGGNSYNASTGQYSGVNPWAGISAARGGRIGYADGGAPSFDDRFYGISPPDDGVINPDQPYRMPSPAAMDQWRGNNPIPPLGTPPDQSDDGIGSGVAAIDKAAGVAPQGDTGAMAFAPKSAGVAPAPQEEPDDPNIAALRATAQRRHDEAYAPQAAVPNGSDAGNGIFGLSANAKSGLLAAGLGMLANRSPFLGVAIGEGGQKGLETYGAAQQSDQKVASEARKLSDEAKKAADDLALKTEASARASDKTPEGYRANAKGNYEAIPGGPADPAVLKSQAVAKAAAEKPPIGYQRTPDGTLAFIKGGPHDPDVIAAETTARTKKGTELDDDTVDAIAHRVAQGDTRAVIGLGRNPAGIAQIQKRTAEIFKEQGLDHEEGAKQILSNMADQAGRMTSERTSAGIATKLAIYGRNVDNAIGVAEKASEEANRTNFVPVNKAINAFKTQTGDPKTVALGQALTTLTNEYARAVGGGHGTVHDKEQAEQHLNQAQSHEQLKAIMAVMRQEVEMTKKSMPEARQEMHDLYAPKGAVPQPAVAPAATAKSTTVIQNGHTYTLGPDGQYH